MMARNYGLTGVTTRSAVGGNQPSGPHLRESTPRNHFASQNTLTAPNGTSPASNNCHSTANDNPPRWPNSRSKAGEFFIPSETDKDFAALCFALFGLTCPFALVAFAVLIWFAFF